MAKKGQAFHTYTEELKRKVARLKLEEGCHIRQRFGIKSDAQIANWVKKVQNKWAEKVYLVQKQQSKLM